MYLVTLILILLVPRLNDHAHALALTFRPNYIPSSVRGSGSISYSNEQCCGGAPTKRHPTKGHQ